MADIRIGISGWNYAPWRGTFFPRGLVQREELSYAADKVGSIEINGTFYSLQRPESYGSWHDRTPPNFIFSVKGPRFITHMKRLKNVAAPLANFFASGVLRLGAKLGPILWQLPPHFRYDAERLAAFFDFLPRDTLAAARLAKKHDAVVKRTWLEKPLQRPLRYALEVRHPTFVNEAFIALLRKHEIALVVADTAGKWPFMEDVTADFVYVRLHGDAELYVSGYSPESLRAWARKIRAWHKGANPAGTRLHAKKGRTVAGGRDVFVYFDNDVKTHAPFDAMTLMHELDVGPPCPPRPDALLITETARTRWPEIAKKPRRATPRAAR